MHMHLNFCFYTGFTFQHFGSKMFYQWYKAAIATAVL